MSLSSYKSITFIPASLSFAACSSLKCVDPTTKSGSRLIIFSILGEDKVPIDSTFLTSSGVSQ